MPRPHPGRLLAGHGSAASPDEVCVDAWERLDLVIDHRPSLIVAPFARGQLTFPSRSYVITAPVPQPVRDFRFV